MQWQLSIDNYSKLRKRQNQQLNDAEAVQQQPSPEQSFNLTAHDTVCKDVQATDIGFPEYKQSLWRKTMRSVLLRLRGQEQHKDVYVMPQHLRAQLKQMYVY